MNKFINDEWEFTPKFTETFMSYTGEYEHVRLPHTCAETPYNQWGSSTYEMICGYRRKIFIDETLSMRRIFIRFEGAAHYAEIYFNGNKVGTHRCGYTEFSVEVTKFAKFGQENELVVRLDTREQLNIPPFGFVIDYMTYGGLYREVSVEDKPQTFISDVFVKADADGNIECETIMDGQVLSDMEISAEITDAAGNCVFKGKTKCGDVIRGKANVFTKWSVDNPFLYECKIKLISKDGELQEKNVKIGFRTAEFKTNGFYLNGKPLKLHGLNRHQSYPYVGYAMPKSMQVRDADILKNELGVNIVRTSHYPQSQYFIDRCDEIGLLVFTEIPGWQHIGDAKWKDQAVENTKEMVIQYRNHPSIILWGVRINESQDDDEFYEKTNALARKLDPTRATTGVRYIEKSSLLEDVYAYNDFSHTGNNDGLRPKNKVTKDMNKSYIVSECNGHMYPTKAFDDEEHRLSHALRHAAVLESMYSSENITGVHGWCMFDYNTHKDFGSGDGICYHGVMDMFRNPKMAAYVYASQSDLKDVCEISSSMNIGEHPAGNIGNVYAFTNADSIKLYKNNEFVKEFYPDKTKYGHMPHPPVIIDDFIGCLIEKNEKYGSGLATEIKDCLNAIAKYGQSNLPLKYKLKLVNLMVFKHFKFEDGVKLYGKYVGNWGGEATKYRFDAIKEGEVVKSVTRKPGGVIHLEADVDHTELIEGQTYDVAAIRIKAVDDSGCVANYFMEPVKLSTEGDIEIIGPDVISLKGGMGGTFIRTKGVTGEGKLIITNTQTNKIEIKFKIK